eukprot:gnl/Dysnectes_brevis/6839_a10914_353.p1 GENE.gnl/Dysnectes_brevis/6839_a10914_353~~gnl/Dysnectes_brevis/6839_a10914_353.p1  ORF type:complete len:553 (+),score=147.65 gnl/Dysnectes_brevis/6839_a10914_353:82-1659(+)
MSRKTEKLKKSSDGKSDIAAASYSINYVVGVGLLSLPAAAAKAGWFLSTLILCVLGLISTWTMNWIAIAIGRAQQIQLIQKRSQQSPGQGLIQSARVTAPVDDDRSLSLGDEDEDAPQLVTEDGEKAIPSFAPSNANGVLEVSEMLSVVCGPRWRNAMFSVLIVYMVATLVSFSIVFVESATQLIPLPPFTHHQNECDVETEDWGSNCEKAFFVWAVIYIIVVCYLSLKELEEQKAIQMSLTVLRFIALAIIVSTTIYGLYSGPYPDTAEPRTDLVAPFTSGLPAVRWSGFGAFFSTCAFAFLSHHSTPVLIGMMGRPHKATSVFAWTFFVIFLLYLALCVSSVLYFGEDIASVASLQWLEFELPTHWLGNLLRTTVLVFPCADLISVYPMLVVTLSNNINYFMFSGKGKASEVGKSNKRTKAVRVSLCVIPIYIGYKLRDFTVVSELCGLLAFMIMFFAPIAAVLNSEKKVIAIWGKSASTKHSFGAGFSTRRSVIWSVCVFSVFAFGICLKEVITLIKEICSE